MKDSMVNSPSDKASQDSSLRRLKTFTNLNQTPEATVLSGGVESAGSTSGINPIDLLMVTPHLQAVASRPVEPPPEVTRSGNEANITPYDALEEAITPTTLTFATHLEENIKPKLDQWREYNRINKNKIPDEAIINRSNIDTLIHTVTKALSIFYGHPTLLEIKHIANRIAMISEMEWKSVQEASMNGTLTAFNKMILALTQTAESLQDTHNDTMAYWDEYEQEQLQILKKTSAALLIENPLGVLDTVDTQRSETADALVEHAFKNATDEFNTELNTLLMEKVKLHKSERIHTLAEASKYATKASQKYFTRALNKLPTLKAESQSARQIKYILPELFSASGHAFKSAAADFDKSHHALKKPKSTADKTLTTAYTMGKKTGSLLKSSIERMGTDIVGNVVSTIGDAAHTTLDYTRTKLPSFAKRGASIIQGIGLSSKKRWENSLIPAGQDSLNFDASLSVTPLEILAATQDLLVATQRLLASAHAANKAEESVKNTPEPKQKDLTTLPNTLSRDFKSARSEEQQLNVLTLHSIQIVMEIEREALTKKSLKSNYNIQSKNKKISTLGEAKSAALLEAPRVQEHTSDEAFKASIDATLEDIDPRFKRAAERKLISLSNTIKPVANLLFEAATDLVNAATLHTETQPQIELMIVAVKQVENKIRTVKTTIKLALIKMTGSVLNNYSHRGLLAKDIGEFIASEKAAYLKDHPGTESEVDAAVGQMFSELQSDLTTPEDRQGKVLGKWIKIAVKDAENDALSWPASLEDILSQHPKIKQYLHEWGAKKFTYNLLLGMVSTTLQESARTLERLGSIHPQKKLLRPRMAYLKVLLAPLTIALVIRGLGQATRVGENPKSAIHKFLKLETGKLAFRLFTSVLPSAAITALSGALTFNGLYKGGKYNDQFLELAKKRMAFNLLSASIEQPFMQMKTQRLTQAQRYFSAFKNIPESSSTASSDEREIIDLESDIEVTTEYSDFQPLTTDVYKDSSALHNFTNSQQPTASVQVIPELSNKASSVVQGETVYDSDIAMATKSSDSQSLPTDIHADTISVSAANTERAARTKRAIKRPTNRNMWVEDEDTRTENKSTPETSTSEIYRIKPRDPDKDKLTLLLRHIAKTKNRLSILKNEDALPSAIDEKQKELDDKEKELELLSRRLPAELVTETTRQFIKSEVYARNMLEEMKAYYPKAVGRIWNDFDPDQEISFSFYKTDPSDPNKRITHRGKATLADFLNGNVRRVMTRSNCHSPITFEGSHARTEVAEDLNIRSGGYAPGLWNKIKTLNNLVTPEDKVKEIARPLTTDVVTVKVYIDSTSITYKKISLDDFIRNRYLTTSEKTSGLNTNPEVTWPAHYKESWQKAFTAQAFLNDYMRGDTAIKISALSTPTVSNHVKVLATKLWDDENFSNRIKAHPQLKLMTPDSIITFEEYRFGVRKKTSMSFLDFITEGRHRIKYSDQALIIDPPGLTLDDPLLKDMIEANVAARQVIIRLNEVEAAAKRIKIPTVKGRMQEKLDQLVIDQSTGSGKYKHIKLTDKVVVNFKGSQKNDMYSMVSPAYRFHKYIVGVPAETKEFTVYELMQKAHERYAIAQSYTHVVVDPDATLNAGVLNHLLATNWQIELQNDFLDMKNDASQRKDWKTVIAPLIADKNGHPSPPHSYATMQFKDRPLSGVYKVSKAGGRFELRSLFNTTYYEFRDVKHMEDAFIQRPATPSGPTRINTSPSLQPGQHDDQFYSWLRPHMTEYQKTETPSSHLPAYVPAAADHLGSNARTTNRETLPQTVPEQHAESLGTEELADALFTGIFEQLYDDADTLIKSDSELASHTFFQTLTDLGPLISGLTAGLSGGTSIALGLVLAALPFAELLVSDTAQESREIFLVSFINAAIDYKLDIAAKPAIASFIKKGLPAISRALKTVKRTGQLFDPSNLKALNLDSWKHAIQESMFAGKIKYKTSEILSTKLQTPKFDSDMNVIPRQNHSMSELLTSGHAATTFNDPFIAKKGDLVVFLATPREAIDNDEKEVEHVMVCVGDGLFSGVGNDVLDSTLSSGKQLFTTEELIKLGERGLPNADDVTHNTPLTIQVITPEDVEAEPEKPTSKIYIPNKQYNGHFGDRATWQNLTGFFIFESYDGSSKLTIKNHKSQIITLQLSVSETGARWELQWSPGLLNSSDTHFIESDSLDDILINFETLLDNLQDVSLEYEVTLPDGFKETGHMKNFAYSMAFEDSPHVLDHSLPETNGYWDNILNTMSKDQWADAIEKYLKGKPNLDLSSESNLFNFLITYHRYDNLNDQAENAYSIDQIKEYYKKIISSRTVAGILNEILKSAGYIPPEGSDNSPFSKQGLSTFLGTLANTLTSDNYFGLDHDTLSVHTLNMQQFNKDLTSMTREQGFSSTFSGWILPIIYKNKKAI